jgi:phosphoenolpyruvate synthase/pyruvate phosphate dikinase
MNNRRDDPHESAIPLVLPLDAAAAALAQVGGKGAALARMKASGLPVVMAT